MDSSNQHAPGVSYPDSAQVAADFDRIASLPTGLGLDHSGLYHPLLLDAVPPGCGEALDVGCGAGALALAASTALQIARTGRPLSSAATRAAWRDHGSRDHYLSMREAKALAARCLPGAPVREHFFFRYSLVWKKP